MRFKKDHMSMPWGLSAVSFWKSLDCPATQYLLQLDTTGYHCLSWQCQIQMCFHHPQSSDGSCQTFPFKEATSLPGLLFVVSLTDPDMQIEYQESSASPFYPHANPPPPYVEACHWQAQAFGKSGFEFWAQAAASGTSLKAAHACTKKWSFLNKLTRDRAPPTQRTMLFSLGAAGWEQLGNGRMAVKIPKQINAFQFCAMFLTFLPKAWIRSKNC